jgi:hypothetical protein
MKLRDRLRAAVLHRHRLPLRARLRHRQHRLVELGLKAKSKV